MTRSSFTAETLALMKTSLGNKFADQGLTKALTTSGGLTYYDLKAPSKLLVPWITPLRNKLPRVGRPVGYGTAAHWKSIFAVNGSGFDSQGWVPEGQRSGVLSYTATDELATYVTLGEESALTFEAESAAQGFEDANAQSTFILLEKMMLKEETALLGGNFSIALGTPATPALSESGTTGTLPTLNPYSVIVVALTQEGYSNSSVLGGVATVKTVTGADGNTYTINGGSSNKSASGTQAITLGQILSATVTPIRGAVAYAWYVGAAGNETLQSITATAFTTFSAPLSTGNQNASAITADHSRNNGTGGNNPVTAFDGMMTTAFAAGSNAYYNSLGTTLTASGSGTVVEIDNMLQTMWDTYRVSPTVIWVNSQQLKDIKNKCLSNSSSPLLRVNQDASGRPYELRAGGTITFYFNPFGTNGGTEIPIMLHPTLAPGTILAYAEELPSYYKNNDTPQVAEVITRRDYYRIDWPLVTRQRQYGVYAEEVLAVYAPFAMGILTNVQAG